MVSEYVGEVGSSEQSRPEGEPKYKLISNRNSVLRDGMVMFYSYFYIQ